MSEPLRPCPFCGFKSVRLIAPGPGSFRVVCMGSSPMADSGCGVELPAFTEAEAIANWNRRTYTAQDVEEMELAKVRGEDGKPEYLWKPGRAWISVEERLPEEGERVLVVSVGLDDGPWVSWVVGRNSRGHVLWRRDALPATHWMPIPEVPK